MALHLPSKTAETAAGHSHQADGATAPSAGRSLFALRQRLQQSGFAQQACYAFGLIGMKAVAFLLLPYLTATLGAAEFARLETLLVLVNGATLFVGCGLVNNLYRQAGQAQSQHDKNRISATLTGSALLLALISFVLLSSLSPWLLPLLNQYWSLSLTEYLLLSLLISSEGVLAVPLAWLRMQEKAFSFLQLTLGRTLLYALLTVSLLKLGYGLEGVLWASVTAVSLQVLLLLAGQQRSSGIRLNASQLPQQIRFGVPFIISGLAMYATQGLDLLLLSQFSPPEQLAGYILAVKFFLLAALLSQPFQLWWYPRRFGLSKQQAADGAMAGAILAGILGLGVAVTAPWLTLLIFPPELHSMGRYLPWLILAGVLKQWGALFNLGCFTTERSEIQMTIELASGLFCLLLFPLALSHFAVQGLLAVLIVSQLLRCIAYLLISQRLQPLPYNRRWLPVLLLPCALLIWQGLYLPPPALTAAENPTLSLNQLFALLIGTENGSLQQSLMLAGSLLLSALLFWLSFISRYRLLQR